MVIIRFQGNGGSDPLNVNVSGTTISIAMNANVSGAGSAGCFIVPASGTYNASTTGGSSTIYAWSELR